MPKMIAGILRPLESNATSITLAIDPDQWEVAANRLGTCVSRLTVGACLH